LFIFIVICLFCLSWDPLLLHPEASTTISGTVKFNCEDSESTIRSRGAAMLQVNGLNIYIGTNQVSGNNQNPIVKAFNTGTGSTAYCRRDYEQSGVDGRGYGLHWNSSALYAIFSIDGGSSTQLSAAAAGNAQDWTRSYGRGGGPKIAVIARLNPGDGRVIGAAFISSQLSNGRTNSLAVTGVNCTNTGRIQITANAWFHPRRIDGSRMQQQGDGGSPHAYTIELTPNLRTVTHTSAVGWESIGPRSNTVNCPANPPPGNNQLQGRVTLQARSIDGNQIQVEIYSGGTLIGSRSVTPRNSEFSIANMASDSYIVRVKHSQHLAVVQNVVLPGPIIDFGRLPAGDINNDNRVTLQDFSLLTGSFNLNSQASGFDVRADLNGDGTVTLQDFSLLVSNFNRRGDTAP
jgi:hypothetical protein